jgi:uncharacterized protein (DUF58 family)
MPFLSVRFFILMGGVVALFAISYGAPALLPIAKLVLLGVFALTLADLLLLFTIRKRHLVAKRTVPQKCSLGDPNPIHLQIQNTSRVLLTYTLYDELPLQLQRRDFQINSRVAASGIQMHNYDITPTTRGTYSFGHALVYASTPLGLVERKFTLSEPMETDVYPSIIQMKRFELRATQSIAQDYGIKRIRRIGHSYEFEQIKNYVEGDDYRSINWKASSRRNTLMVNQYEDERSQQVYCIIDKSRVMRMPFEGMSLMDYAINSTLALSNIILKKQDKAGLLTFSDVMGATLRCERDTGQLRRIMESLYREKERPLESNFELLYEAVRRLVAGRSLLILFTNFESHYALDRALPLLRRLNSSHLLVVVFFENTEIRQLAQAPVERTFDIFEQTVARQFIQDKKEMAARLRQYGIQSVLTRPEDLTLQTINKYLELKSRGMI